MNSSPTVLSQLLTQCSRPHELMHSRSLFILCEMMPLADSQHVRMNVHPMTAPSKCIIPGRPEHFSPAFRKVLDHLAGTKISEISVRSRDKYTKALGSSEGGRNPIA